MMVKVHSTSWQGSAQLVQAEKQEHAHQVWKGLSNSPQRADSGRRPADLTFLRYCILEELGVLNAVCHAACTV